ncbi:hypothetical protein [uncultured Maribacter sp.]|uniref:hypothetical protein n=1 Tax=uncultured Maribacter sp. TaxID=431308 RepID=UPI002635C0F1|nr:hypothetical protein [uncultured Maribacter sp.]
MNFKKVAKQLAKPSGKFGIDVALGMNTMNKFISKTTYELLQIKDNECVLEIGLGNINSSKGYSKPGIEKIPVWDESDSLELQGCVRVIKKVI